MTKPSGADQGSEELRRCEAFTEALYQVLDAQYWGAIDWDEPEQGEHFREAIREAWLLAFVRGKQ